VGVEGAGVVNLDRSVEPVRQTGAEIGALALGVGTVADADGALRAARSSSLARVRTTNTSSAWPARGPPCTEQPHRVATRVPPGRRPDRRSADQPARFRRPNGHQKTRSGTFSQTSAKRDGPYCAGWQRKPRPCATVRSIPERHTQPLPAAHIRGDGPERRPRRCRHTITERADSDESDRVSHRPRSACQRSRSWPQQPRSNRAEQTLRAFIGWVSQPRSTSMKARG